MGEEPTTAEKMRRLPWSLAGNSANAVFSQLTFFGSVFVLFLSQLGLSTSTIGFLLSLIPFFGLVALFVAPTVARVGYKRVYITGFTLRKIVTLGLLLAPWVLAQYGPQVLLWSVIAILSLFSLLRAIAITASHPWEQEYIPDSVRGKYAAANQIVTGITGFLAVTAAGAFLGPDPALRDFGVLFVVGTAAGLVSMWAYVQVPGGAPQPASQADSASHRGLFQAARDPNLSYFLAGIGLVTLASTGLGSFVPLFMRDTVGLTAGQVVGLQSATMVGGLLTSFAWGWAADRYGSRPVTLLGLYLKAVLPIFWFVMPRGTSGSLPIALGTAAWQGVANMGWTIGSTRLLFNDVVPRPKRAGYMAVHYAWISTVEGLSQLLSGRVLDLTASLQGQWLGFALDRYSILFAAGTVLPLLASVPLGRVRAPGSISVTGFAGMFLRGRPLLAMESLIGYQLARDEPTAVTVTERLGRARSPLTVQELVESLSDPRFNVRFEAVVSMAHHGADPRLTQALVETLHGRDPALSSAAAWALGRGGDPQAIPALRQGLLADYRSVRAPCARSLATLGDVESAPVLLEQLLAETDEGLQIAYAAAMGMLRYEPATGALLDLLQRLPHEQTQMELALALARILGEERFFVQLRRQLDGETGTALSQAVTALRRKLHGMPGGDRLAEQMTRGAERLAREDLEEGIAVLAAAWRELPWTMASPHSQVLQACVRGMEGSGAERLVYLLLALHTLNALPEES